ncbi:DUF2018 family protein [Campylobacter gastrosuis]|uniref:DUF2018 family protein n=1 Tax=Campylobacter gastrosuis TaxID=2974576 RepID=A0ABT7HN49_9BACT|nr:DUF2018 family protein [Campylobacter gastrosuis]MDL0088334.1 DUF2018 family protein [Campylobacter gastrosuis]
MSEIFDGLLSDKFFDVIFNANRNLVKDELMNLVNRLAVLEILAQKHGLDSDLVNFEFSNLDEIKSCKDDIFMQVCAGILSKNE